jgi:hypothetical protein
MNRIIVNYGDEKQIAARMNCSIPTVRKALLGTAPTAVNAKIRYNEIRKTALKLGGKLYEEI